MISDRTANVIIAVVTVVSVLNILSGMFGYPPHYEPSDMIHGIFLTIVGGALGLKGRGEKGGGGSA